MLIKLPRECSGEEVVEQFKAAVASQAGPEERWEPQEFGEPQYEPGSVKQTIRNMGVCARLYFSQNKWILFGKKVWRKSYPGTKFTLVPVEPSKHYNEIEMGIEYEFFYKRGVALAIDSEALEFQGVRLQFEKMLGEFYLRLQPQHI